MARKKRQRADQCLLLALACGATVEHAARQCGVSESTVYRQLEDRDFRRQVEALRAGMVQRAAGLLTAAAVEAVKALLDLLKATTSVAVRLGAARAVLEIGVKFREMADLEERLAALEEQLDAEGEQRTRNNSGRRR
jgi:AcrR family transcriptional regulator